jgi:2',3'-cyclic-nucleotide 2'-phosphodiesterase (5'-nucleotidase family)
MRRRYAVPFLTIALVLGLLAAPALGQERGGPPAGQGLDRALENVQNDTARRAIQAAKERQQDRPDRGHAKPVEITLLHDTHFHGKFASSGVGIAEYFGFAQERMDAAKGHAFFVANGDDIAPSLLSGVFEPHGIHMIEALNEAPVDVNTLGNHEFDFGPDNLRTLLAKSDTTWVTANVRDAHAPDQAFGKDLGVEQFVLRSAGDVTVGFTGLAPENMASITSLTLPGDESAAVQIPALDALQEVVPEMRAAGADIVVVASHLCGTRAIEIADVYDGVDVFVGDHCAQILEEPYVSDSGTIVSLAHHEFDYLGELTLRYHKGAITGHEFTLHDLRDRELPVNQAIQDIVDRYNEQLDEELNVVIGERTVDWDTRVGVVRTSETAFGNFLTDEMRAFHDSDIAVQNSGGIRADDVFPAGDITRREIAEILPFANHLVKAEIRGEHILAALEHSVRLYPNPNGAFLQVSGLEFTFDPSQPAGSRVVDVLIGGEPLDPDRTYTMATNDFTLGGGDGYTWFRDHTHVLVGSNEGPLLSTFLINRIENRTSPVDTDVEGRITTVG